MIKEKWLDLVIQNPMLIEITRFRRRYTSASATSSMNGVVVLLCIICYATLLLVVIQNRASISPIVMIFAQTAFLTVLAPMLLYGSISGERERRSWDLLLVAPITKPQIVVGKFMGAMAALGVAVILFQVPIEIAATSYDRSHWQSVLVADLVSVTFLMCVCALTILFSARVKRSLMALGATLGSLVTILIVFPALVGLGQSGPATDAAFFLHPFVVLSRIGDRDDAISRNGAGTVGPGTSQPDFPSNVPAPWWGWPQTLTYLGLTIVLLAWASNTLNFAENEVKFLPQGHKDA